MGEGKEVVVTGSPEASDTRAMIDKLNSRFSPHQVVLLKSDRDGGKLAELSGFVDGLQVIEGKTTVHVCKGFSCKEPTADLETMVKQVLNKMDV